MFSLFNDIDYEKAEFVHKSTQFLQKYDMSEGLPSDSASNLLSSSSSSSNVSIQSTNTVTTATLSDCFELFTEREHLTDENSWLCPKCQKQTNAYKKLCISSVPPILIIHLKRFFYKSKTSNFKLTTPVWFPITGLDISKYIDKSTRLNKSSSSENNSNFKPGAYECEAHESHSDDDDDDDEPNPSQDDSYIYDLFAVTNHKGQNMANGHYTGKLRGFLSRRLIFVTFILIVFKSLLQKFGGYKVVLL